MAFPSTRALTTTLFIVTILLFSLPAHALNLSPSSSSSSSSSNSLAPSAPSAPAPLHRRANGGHCHPANTCHIAFKKNLAAAKTYCAANPNPHNMAPMPKWSQKGCKSIGRRMNARVRLVGTCSCLKQGTMKVERDVCDDKECYSTPHRRDIIFLDNKNAFFKDNDHDHDDVDEKVKGKVAEIVG